MFLKSLPLFLLFTISSVQRPLIDFDQVIDGLKDKGQWESVGEEIFAFRPTSKNAAWRPFREGQWLYTDYGWTWTSNEPSSWATDHYGTWTKRKLSNWAWMPDGQWISAPVEWLKNGNHIGWRPSKLDRFSNLLESPAERYSDPTEWNFVLKDKLKGTLKPEDFVDDALAEKLLKNAGPADHVFVSYREIPRPGPAPDILKNEAGQLPIVPVIREQQELSVKVPILSPEDLYVFRPKFHQDNDGIMRRVYLYLNPRSKQESDANIKETIGDKRTDEEKTKEMKKMERALEQQRRHNETLYR